MAKMYEELAVWWQLISPLAEYKEEFDFFRPLLAPAARKPASTLLELGSGGGSNAYYLKSMFSHVILSDLSPQMLEVSRAVNPECEHIVGDMRTLRLHRLFDAVFIHDAIEYMTTPQELKQAMKTAFVHCKPGGTVVFVPDQVKETFEPGTDHGGSNGAGRALRFMEWTYDPNENDTTYNVDYVYVLHEDNQPTRIELDQHTCGVFSRAQWRELLSKVGFQSKIRRDPFGRDVFIAHKPKGKTK